MDKNRKSSVIIRLATSSDVAAISETYTHLLKYEQEPGSNSNWQLGVYPTIETARSRTAEGMLYVIEEDGNIVLQGLIPEAQVYLECLLE